MCWPQVSCCRAMMPNISIIRAYRSLAVAVGRTLNGLVATATTCTPVLPAAAATDRRSCSSSARSAGMSVVGDEPISVCSILNSCST